MVLDYRRDFLSTGLPLSLSLSDVKLETRFFFVCSLSFFLCVSFTEEEVRPSAVLSPLSFHAVGGLRGVFDLIGGVRPPRFFCRRSIPKPGLTFFYFSWSRLIWSLFLSGCSQIWKPPRCRLGSKLLTLSRNCRKPRSDSGTLGRSSGAFFSSSWEGSEPVLPMRRQLANWDMLTLPFIQDLRCRWIFFFFELSGSFPLQEHDFLGY